MKVSIFSTVTELSAEAIYRLDRIIALGADIMIGDTDRAIQNYLHSRAYTKVVIHYSGKKPKVNIGYPEKGGYISAGVRDLEISKKSDWMLTIGTNAQIKKNIAAIGSDKVRLVAIEPIRDLSLVPVAA
jgi:hypothetical protein